MKGKADSSYYAQGRLAFQRMKGEPAIAKPQDCRLLEREKTIIWQKRGEHALEGYKKR